MPRLLDNIERVNNVSFIKTTKYKDVTCYINFVLPYSAKTKAALKVLSIMLFETNNKYKTKKEMSRIKDYLYDAIGVGDTQVVSGLCIFNAQFSFINPKYIKDIKEEDYIDFINEILRNPNFSEKSFLEIKRIVIDQMHRKLDDPTSLALENFFHKLSDINPIFDQYLTDYSKDIEELSIDDVKDVYKELFNSCIYVYCFGDYSNSFKEYLCSYKSQNSLYANQKAYDIDDRSIIIENKNIKQSSLIVSYTTSILREDKDYYPMIVANKLLGDSSDSLLFQNVREKLSLCYSIGLLSLKSEGLIMIITEINKSNFDKTIEEIDKQIINAKNGEFDDELFASTKLQFANAIHSLGDDIDGFVAFDMMLKLNNIDISVDEHLRRIMAVKKEDVVRALNTYKKSITYFLKGDLDE